MKIAAKNLAYTAMFTAICFLTNYLYIPFGELFSISFAPLVLFTSSFFLNPLLAFAVGAISDTLGCFAKGYAPNLFILLATSLWGLIMGIFYRIKWDKPILKIIIGAGIGFIVCSLLLNSYGLYTYTSKGVPFFNYMLLRAPVQLLNLSVNVFLTILLERGLKKRGLLNN